MSVRGFEEFVTAIRETLAPVAHLTDAELSASDLPAPVIRLLLGLRASLRTYEATSEVSEREWADKFGTHWEVRQTDANGNVHIETLTRRADGSWPDRGAARAAVARAAATGRKAQL